MPPAGLQQTEMDEEALLELELQQELDRINLDNDPFAGDGDAEINNNDVPEFDNITDGDAAFNLEGEGVPSELQDYLNTIQKQRLKFEEELEECDALMDRTISSAKGEGNTGGEVSDVASDYWQELEEGAALEGLTVEEYKKKLLQDIENEPFELEEMDFITDDSEFLLPESRLEVTEVLNDMDSLSKAPPLALGAPSADEEMVQKALTLARALAAEEDRKTARPAGERMPISSEHEDMLALTYMGEDEKGETQLVPVSKGDEEKREEQSASGGVAADEGEGMDASDGQLVPVAAADEDDAAEEKGKKENEEKESRENIDKKEVESEHGGTLALLHMHPLQEFEQYLREQFQLAEERFRQREERLKQELAARRAVEEKLMLAMEEQKLQTMQALQHEEELLAHKKEESQKKLDQEIERRQKVFEVELKQHEETIAQLTAELEEDHYQLEKIERAEKERLAQKTCKAATSIQRCYRGYRVRKLHEREMQTMAEKKEQRRQEKQERRIEEIEQEIKLRKAEEARKEEEAKRAKMEEERKIEEEKKRREEEERKKKEEEEREKREEEERKRKAEEQKRLEEEERRQREEEGKKKKEEERKRKEEEKRRKKEEEEKKKKEEAKRKEEDEKKRKEEEERKKKEEEERKKKEEAERKKKEEEEGRKRLEEERKRKEEEEQRLEEEERKKKEEERKKKEEERKKKAEAEGKAQEEAEERRKKEDEEETQVAGLGADGEELRKKGEGQSMVAVVNTRSDIKQRQTEESEKGPRASPVVFTLEPVNANNLPESLEERRLAWMKQCLPWSKLSNEPWKAKSGSEGKVPRRPASAKKLTPLPDSIILGAAQVASLKQVTTVELCELPGHALSPLGACVNLKHLKMTHCGLIALDSLSQCKHLQCIDVQENLIEFVDLKEVSSLYSLNLSHNKLTSVHGLTGCTNLRWLDMSHNRLTKLAGLAPLRRLHTLLASNNQLVSTSGVELCPTIQQLDLSANYLTAVEGLGKLGLLLSLNVASNNLTQMPSLDNNVLLQELILRENSLGPDLDLSAAWLPLLSYLDLSQNVIEELTGSASGLFVLKRLDLAVNQITEVSSFLPTLRDCPRLEDLSLEGNAVLDEDNLRENVKNVMQCLLCLNGETLRSQASTRPVRSFEMLCLTQVQLHKDIKQTLEKECRSSAARLRADNTHICDDYFRFCDKSFRMAVEHRYAHEYGELSSANIPSVPQTPRSARPSSGRSPKASAQAVSARLADPHSPANLSNKSPSETPSQHSAALDLHKAPCPTEIPQERITPPTKEKSPLPKLSEKEKFEMALRGELAGQLDAGTARDSSHHTQSSVHTNSTTGASGFRHGWGEGPASGTETGDGMSLSGAAEKHCGMSLLGAGDTGRQRLQADTLQQRQLSEKEKFDRALAGLSSNSSPLPPVGVTVQEAANGQLQMRMGGAQKLQGQGSTGITADLVGDLMMSDPAVPSRAAVPGKFSDEDIDLDDLENLEEMMEGLQFDIDGFLDLDQFDFDEDFLEQGWRPDDTPQLPQKIPSSNSSAKPPRPPLPSVHGGASQHPAPPPGRPAQAWRGADSPLSDVQARVPPLRPPSSVASGEDSQAITTGRSRREERLAEEWGFKDSRTAEMMMQRAKKMKYNAERRKKLSKLDPQQRLRLFRKLEEVKGVSAVRPPPARVLPRKEYFQAREEEAQQRELEKHQEYRTRAGRTFEWLHTQVGDYNVSSSRINPGPAGGMYSSDSPPMKTTSDSQLSCHPSPPMQHGHSPLSLDMESVSYASGQRPVRHQQHSLGGEDLSLTGQATVLPPIKTGSAPGQRSREREKMSWRTEPVEKSVGWGGGKKRSVRK